MFIGFVEYNRFFAMKTIISFNSVTILVFTYISLLLLWERLGVRISYAHPIAVFVLTHNKWQSPSVVLRISSYSTFRYDNYDDFIFRPKQTTIEHNACALIAQ